MADQLPDDRDAPQSALTGLSFWDHLGATRAEEYARENILPDVILPEPPADLHATLKMGARPLPMGDMSAVHGFSLNASLNAPEDESWPEDARAPDPLADLPVTEPAMPDVAAPFTASPQAEPDRPVRRRGAGRLTYRLQRIWLTPGYRFMVKFGLPALALVAAIGAFLGDPARRDALVAQYDMIRDTIIDRPEFMVTELQLPDMSPELDHTLRQTLDVDLPQSSFRLDLDALRAEVEALDWVRTADLRLMSGGTLALSVTERVPAILWRSDAGLELLDAEGVRVAFVLQRNLRPDLPLVAGAGADAHIPQALDLLDAASPLGDRLRGLVRMGERRWDVVLDRNQRIRLPERGPVAALERVLALDEAQDLLARDLLVVDLRNPARPVLQLSAGAMETLEDIRSQSMEAMQ